MHRRVIYWCGWLDPQMVAVSKEMSHLMREFRNSVAFSISNHYWLAVHPSTRRYGVHRGLYPVMRHILPALERAFDVNHVYTGLADWHFLNVLGRRPIVLTVTQRGVAGDGALLRKVSHVVAESPALAASARQAGVPRERISVAYPGVDLDEFAPVVAPTSSDMWRAVFASSPENASEVHHKGLDLLIELAAVEPSFSLDVLWRPFGAASDRALADLQRRCPSNVRFHVGRARRIQDAYAAAHFTVAPFRTVGKPCPNSVLEGLAVGRPSLVSTYTDLGAVLEREAAGIAFEPTLESLRRAFRTMCENYGQLQQGARPCAERNFDLRRVIQHYAHVYESVTSAA